MQNLFRAIKFGMVLLIAAIMLVGTLAQSYAETGTVYIKAAKAGFIIGVGGGSGVLNFRGRNYPLQVGGVSIGATIGASSTELIGRAHNMHVPSDITGTYTAVGGGMAIAGGGGAVQLKNSKGVILVLKGRKIGLEFSIDLSGIEISMR